MKTGLIVLWLIDGVMVLCSLLIRTRGEMVFKYRQDLIAQLTLACYMDIQRGWDYKWRIEQYSKVNYDDMMLRFWKPVKSFYAHSKMLDLDEDGGEL